ncbi:MAG: HAD hydrolase family protein [Sulfurimonadaceae bacterium]|jgi:3-deoxy-D-manno-octulosonate 8-phosphate phosphatase (KDO 8-P phosphatase)|nr:HAD hydrolase family protein [Sulfurimonadaceae bacterium]
MIKLIVLDVDGCLTDGKIIYDNNGLESKQFNVKDGFGIKSWLRLGNEVAIITGRDSQIVTNRAKELGITHLYQGVKDKHAILLNILNTLNISLKEVAAIGDDLNDHKILSQVGRSFTPNDAVLEVRQEVQTVLERKGGDAVVREMIDQLVEENNQKEQYLGFWL